jgi:hypothetical protein
VGKGDKSGNAYKLTGKNKYAIVVGTMDKHRWQGLLIMLYINLEPGKNPHLSASPRRKQTAHEFVIFDG